MKDLDCRRERSTGRNNSNDIQPACSEDDLEQWNEGLDLIQGGKLVEDEKKFKMLVVSQPHSSDGFEGLSKVYTKMKRKPSQILD